MNTNPISPNRREDSFCPFASCTRQPGETTLWCYQPSASSASASNTLIGPCCAVPYRNSCIVSRARISITLQSRGGRLCNKRHFFDIFPPLHTTINSIKFQQSLVKLPGIEVPWGVFFRVKGIQTGLKWFTTLPAILVYVFQKAIVSRVLELKSLVLPWHQTYLPGMFDTSYFEFTVHLFFLSVSTLYIVGIQVLVNKYIYKYFV